jgi:hypothetical protein
MPEEPGPQPPSHAHGMRPRGLGRRGTAFVLVEDGRQGFALELVLRELEFSVDLGTHAGAAALWLERVRYDLVIAGGPHAARAGGRLLEALARHQAPPRLVILGNGDVAEEALAALNVEVLRPPYDVNTVIELLGRS